MAVDWWARGIAIAAALATALNMLIAFKTYRRVRPRLDVVVQLAKAEPQIIMNAKAVSFRGHYVFLLRLANRGTTPVSIEHVFLVASYSKWHRRSEPMLSAGAFLEQPLKIEPFDGEQYPFKMPSPDWTQGGKVPRYVQVRVGLRDGREAHSAKMRVTAEMMRPVESETET
ncbi:hypothetical protein [Streptomyces coeruleorubidus]|uniref:hypothetical protein n=1 Tax=Streptomyces coeruleorubidus TaxID=116188 RepID=UPI00187732D2|nr:hypothetical protein [Streptomyces bellus]GGT88828.1 hypothetical protein GCM10010244_12270 [Streptomyces bellus]